VRIDRFINRPLGSAHIADPNQANTTYDGQEFERTQFLAETPIQEKIRHEHRLRNTDEKRIKDGKDQGSSDRTFGTWRSY